MVIVILEIRIMFAIKITLYNTSNEILLFVLFWWSFYVVDVVDKLSGFFALGYIITFIS